MRLSELYAQIEAAGDVHSYSVSLAALDIDFRLLVEVPLLRDESGNDPVKLVEMNGVHLGRASEEAWLLVRPASEYADGLLPA